MPDELALLPEGARKLALDRFRILQPHLEQNQSLRSVAVAAGIPYRTAHRWLAQYRRFGLVALARKARVDRGERRAASVGLKAAIEGLALQKPPLPIAALCRQVRAIAYLDQRDRAMRVEGTVPDPTALLVIDEADRLRMAGLEQVRDIFDRGSFGLVLIGMPGMEKRLARYPQFYSRIGFVHEFRPLGAKEIRQLLDQHWTPPGVQLPQHPLDLETAAAIIRITGGNFRLLNRLLTQIERILEINSLRQVTKGVVEAARESLVIGQS